MAVRPNESLSPSDSFEHQKENIPGCSRLNYPYKTAMSQTKTQFLKERNQSYKGCKHPIYYRTKEVVKMVINKAFEFGIKTQIQFEAGGINHAGETIKALGGKNVLIATDKGLLKANLIDGLIDSLKKEGLAFTIYDEVEPNPTIAVVEKGAGLFKTKGCDFLVGMGGGSSMDTAKVIGLLTTNAGPVNQYEGANKVPNPVPPIIAIPTTAGTGAEVNGSAVITDKARMYKMSIRSDLLVPRVAILDPALILSLPPHIIASTGMDALVHAIESYISLGSSPITKALAIGSIGLISENLRCFYANPANLEAAGKMILASTMAGMSFTNAPPGLCSCPGAFTWRLLQYCPRSRLHSSAAVRNGVQPYCSPP